jgi:alkylated DNA repair dioxygenase AlkB
LTLLLDRASIEHMFARRVDPALRDAAPRVALDMPPRPPPTMSWQASLFGVGEAAIDRSFAGLQREWLDDTTWVDHQAGWLSGADGLLAELVAGVAWRQRVVTMYGRLLDEPRLTAWWPVEAASDLPAPVLVEARAALSERYGRPFDSLGANLYRDGRDSVAWHGDRIARTAVDPIVAIVSLGEPRPFLLRPRGGGPSHSHVLGAGDLLVMGGRCQHDWEHTVPKVAIAGPRLSLTFRHGEPEPASVGSRAVSPGDGAERT